MKHSKAYRRAAELVDRAKVYSPVEAAKLVKETSPTRFDATVEVALRLGVDPRKADQMVRGTVNLPHGTGKTARVIAFAAGDKAVEAELAGADEVGSEDLVARIQGGWLDFDAAALDEVLRVKPSTAKGKYLKKVSFASTMGPGIQVDPNRTRNLLSEEAPAS